MGSLCHTLHQPKPTFPSQEFRVVHPREGSVVTLSSVFNPFLPRRWAALCWPRVWPDRGSTCLQCTIGTHLQSQHSFCRSLHAKRGNYSMIDKREKYWKGIKVGIWRGIAIFNGAVRDVLPEVFSIRSTGRAPVLLEKKLFNSHCRVRSLTSLLLQSLLSILAIAALYLLDCQPTWHQSGLGHDLLATNVMVIS